MHDFNMYPGTEIIILDPEERRYMQKQKNVLLYVKDGISN
jgi:hypothetical protein